MAMHLNFYKGKWSYMTQQDIDNSFDVVDICTKEGPLAIFVEVHFGRR